jgi:hypothetical protein
MQADKDKRKAAKKDRKKEEARLAKEAEEAKATEKGVLRFSDCAPTGSKAQL